MVYNIIILGEQKHGDFLGGNRYGIASLALYVPYPIKYLQLLGIRFKFFIEAGNVQLHKECIIINIIDSPSILSNLRFAAGFGTDIPLPLIGNIQLNYSPYVKY